MRLAVTDRLISRLQMVGSAVTVGVLVLAMGALSIRQIREEYEVSIKEIETQQVRQHQELLAQQVDTAKGFLAGMRARTEAVLKSQIREQVDEAHAMAEAIYNREIGRRPEAEIKRLIIEALRPLRFFEGAGYFFVDGMDGSCVLLPINPNREGTSLIDNRDDTGHYIMRGLIDAARLPVGEGFSRYRWYAPGDTKRMADKIAYVRLFKPFDWLIGTGQYVGDVESVLKHEALERLRSFRFGHNGAGYITVFDEDGRILVSPSQPWDEGKSGADLSEDSERAFNAITGQARQGDGFVRYQWHAVDKSDVRSTKLAYVSRMPDWNWTLSAGLLLDDVEAQTEMRRRALARSINDKLALTVTVLALGVAVALLIGWSFARLTSRLIGRYQTDLTRQNTQLQQQTVALEQSNADLEQFAYVASHDLREPLRMVSSYLSLLERRYGEVFDADGHEFLAFARDGATRMDRLVLDLLDFSRIDRRGSPIAVMSAAAALDVALRNLATVIADSGGRVDIGESVAGARVMGDSGQIVRLFQNLIGNALKYRSPERAPLIRVTALRRNGSWEFAVADNGIGIEAQYFERIFGIFQRLHTREKYEGTGIGLAICKKIVERHGGRIEVASTPGEGSTFRFTLRAAPDEA